MLPNDPKTFIIKISIFNHKNVKQLKYPKLNQLNKLWYVPSYSELLGIIKNYEKIFIV